MTDYISFKDYLRDLSVKNTLLNNNTKLYLTLFKNQTEALDFIPNVKALENLKNDKIVVYLNFIFSISIIMVISSLYLFFMREYRKDWKKDMKRFYIVIII